MATYPKQLQLLDYPTVTGDIREGTLNLGDKVIYSNGFTPPVNVTVNDLLAVISSAIFGVDLTGNTGNIRTRDRYRKFDTSFGDTVVYTGGVAMTSDQAANEMIEVMRILWDAERAVTNDSMGLATSIQN